MGQMEYCHGYNCTHELLFKLQFFLLLVGRNTICVDHYSIIGLMFGQFLTNIHNLYSILGPTMFVFLQTPK